MRLEWAQRARNHVISAREYIARTNPMAAERVASRILETAESLRSSPYTGRPGRISGTRERMVLQTPFIIVYRVTDCVEIQAVLHGRQRWPERL